MDYTNWIKIADLLEIPNLIQYNDEIENKKEEIKDLFDNTDIEYQFNIAEINGSEPLFILELYVQECNSRKASIILDKYDNTFEEMPEELKEEIPENVAKKTLPYNIFWIFIVILSNIALLSLAISLYFPNSIATDTSKTVVWLAFSFSLIITIRLIQKLIKIMKDEKNNQL